MTSHDATNLETSVPADGDRLVTSTIALNVKAGLVSKDVDLQPSTKKDITAYNIKFGTRIIDSIDEI